MADEENHVIRIILEGRDKLSGAFSGARKSIDKDIQGIKKSAADLNKELKVVEDSLFFGNKRVAKGDRGFAAFSKDVEAAGIKVKDLKKELRDILPDLQRKQTGFFGNLKQAIDEAAVAGKNLQAKLSGEQEAVRERKRLLDEETRAGQVKLKQQKFEEKEALKLQQAAREDANRAELSNLKKVQEIRHAKVLATTKEATDIRKKELEEELREIRLNAAIEKIPLVQERRRLTSRKNTDPEAIAELSREIEAIRAARDADISRAREAAKADIALHDAAAARIRTADKQAFEERRRVLSEDRKVAVRQENAELATAQAQRQAKFTAEQQAKGAQIKAPDQDAIRRAEADIRRVNNAAHNSDTIFQRAGRSVGLWAGDLKRGLSEGRKGIVDFESEARQLESRMARIGQRVGSLTGNLGSLVNLRWFFLTSAIQVLGTAVTQLGAAFISVASSAGLAAAAIGTGFAAAVAQALPVVGILAAAFSRVQNVFKAVQLANTNKTATAADSVQNATQQREANERLADSHHALTQAILQVADAQYQLKQAGIDVTDALTRNREAVLNLANTRIQVSRDLVDANFREQQSAISLRSAELGVLDAKRQLRAEEKAQRDNQVDLQAAQGAVREAQERLKAARAASDNAGISDARAQLAVAQQSLSQIQVTAQTTNTAVAEAQVGVKQSLLDVKTARVEKKRAKEDADKANRQGIDGNQQVIAAQRELKASVRAIADARRQQALAQRQVAESLYQVKIATREVADLEADKAHGLNSQIAGQRQLKALLDQLTPSERKLYQSLLNIQSVYRRAFRPITDIIVSAISRAVDRGAAVLKNPKLLAAARTLATAIAGGIDSIAKFASSPRVIKDLSFFIEQASGNLPTLVDALEKFADIFLRLAGVGTPLFAKFLGFIDKVATKLDALVNDSNKSGKFFGLANKNLDAWLKLGEAIGRIVFALAKGSNKAGLKLITDFTAFLNRLADWMKNHPKEVEAFFDRMAKNIEKLAAALETLVPILFKAFTSDNANDFAIFVIKVVIPGLILFTTTMQRLSQAVLFLTNLPVVGPIALWIAQFLVAEKALNKVFPVTQKLTNLLKYLGTTVLGKQVIRGIAAVGIALKGLLLTPPFWVAIIAGIITAVVLLDRKFHFLGPTIKFIRKVSQEVFEWIRDHWKLLGAIFAGPFLLTYLVVLKFRKQIYGVITSIIDFVKAHWKLLATILVSIFLPGAILAIALIKWHDRLIGTAESVVHGIVKWFKKLPGLIAEAIKDAPDVILSVFDGMGGKITNKIIDGLPKPAREALKAAGFIAKNTGPIGAVKHAADVGGFIKKHLAGGGPVYAAGGLGGLGSIFNPLGTDTVPAMLTPGEWVLNAIQQSKLAQILGTSKSVVADFLFGKGASGPGPNPGGIYSSAYEGPNYKLIPHQDADGKTVWFVEFADKTFGQVNALDVKKMLDSHGAYLPAYIRNKHGGLMAGTLRPLKSLSKGALQKGVAFKTPYGLGGAGVSAGRYAQGGPVINSPAGRMSGTSVHQSFNVNTEGETDWNYVMRLGAIHAQESF